MTTEASSVPSHEDLRLQRLAQACRGGDLAGAHLELTEWTQADDCPVAARVLLAALLARDGDHTGACRVLEPAISLPFQASDPAAIRLTLAVLIDAGLHEDARDMAISIKQSLKKDHPLTAWMAVMAVPGLEDHDFKSMACDPMASAIAEAPEAIPAIVRACQLKPEARVISLLRRAISQIVDLAHLNDIQADLCTALAELALLANDRDNARLWAKRGLSLSPFNAQLAIAFDEAAGTMRNPTGSEAVDILARVHTAHPAYPDVTAALIQREHTQGLTDSARHRLAGWLKDQPNQPIARKLQKQIAA